MSRLTTIQHKIKELSPGAYQKLLDSYLRRKYSLSNIMSLGSKDGADKTTKGTPDSFSCCEDGKFILIQHGTVETGHARKIQDDIKKCLDKNNTGIALQDIKQIICCHTSSNLTLKEMKEIHALFPNIFLIGIDDLSQDLDYKYPDLAEEFLGISGRTNQIISLETFLNASKKNQYATPLDTPLLLRDKETIQIEQLFEDKDCVLLFGRSGIGKTRLAIEVARNIACKQNSEIRIVRSNGANICEDLSIEFPDDKNYFVIIDDANEFGKLEWILDFYKINNREHTFKILLTVRDYAKTLVEQTVASVCDYVTYELSPLSDDNIKEILANIGKVTNQELKQRIASIAKGNVRLAIMAIKCVHNKEFEKIANAFDLYNYFFAPIINNFDEQEILVASIVAFFNAFTLNKDSLPLTLAENNGISNSSFKAICMQLHTKEVVEISVNGNAIKFADQNLRDYLIYHIFFIKKAVSPCQVIDMAFNAYPDKVIFAFNTLLRLFYTTDNENYIKREISKAYQHYINTNDELNFIKAFHNAIPDETLYYIKKVLDNSETTTTNLVEFNFDEHKNYHKIDNDLLSLLKDYKYSELLYNALSISLMILEKCCTNPMDLYFFFYEELNISKESTRTQYRAECEILDWLIQYYKNRNTDVAAFSLLFFAAGCLRFDFSGAEAGEDKKITFYRFEVSLCDELSSLRQNALKALLLLYNDTRIHIHVYKELMRYPVPYDKTAKKEIYSADINSFFDNFNQYSAPLSYNDSLLLNHFSVIANKLKINHREINVQALSSFNIFLAMRENYFLDFKDYDAANKAKQNQIDEIAKTANRDTIEELWGQMAKRTTYDTEWNIDQGVGLFMKSLSEYRQPLFLEACDLYISYGTPYSNCSCEIAGGLFNKLGYKQAIAYIRGKDFGLKDIWINTIFDRVPKESYSLEICEQIKDTVSNSSTFRPISIETAKAINNVFPGFMREYITLLYDKTNHRPYVLSDFLLLVGHTEIISCEELVSYMQPNYEMLHKAYILAVKGRNYFDSDGRLLKEIVKQSPDFIKFLIESCDFTYAEGDFLASLWDCDNYISLISTAIDALFEKEKQSFCFYNFAVETILNIEKKKCSREKWLKWIDYYIANNVNNPEKMEFLFNNLCSLSNYAIFNGVITFCKYTSDFNTFNQLSLTPNHASWTGSKIPLIENRIKLLQRIKDELLDSDFIEHRNKLSNMIVGLENEKDRILLLEFLE